MYYLIVETLRSDQYNIYDDVSTFWSTRTDIQQQKCFKIDPNQRTLTEDDWISNPGEQVNEIPWKDGINTVTMGRIYFDGSHYYMCKNPSGGYAKRPSDAPECWFCIPDNFLKNAIV